MKYIKKYENNIDVELDKLITHIFNFLSSYNIKIKYKEENYNIIFFWCKSSYYYKAIFNIKSIDYYYGEIDKFFSFKIDKSFYSLDDDSGENIELFLFINNIMSKYNKNQNMIKYNDIENIIVDINNNNFEVFKNTKKYNI